MRLTGGLESNFRLLKPCHMFVCLRQCEYTNALHSAVESAHAQRIRAARLHVPSTQIAEKRGGGRSPAAAEAQLPHGNGPRIKYFYITHISHYYLLW